MNDARPTVRYCHVKVVVILVIVNMIIVVLEMIMIWYMVMMIGICGIDIMITMMTKLMIIRLAQDEEELTATMIRFVEEPEDRTKQARKVAPLTILNIYLSNMSSSATSNNHIETPSDPPKIFTVPLI